MVKSNQKCPQTLYKTDIKRKYTYIFFVQFFFILPVWQVSLGTRAPCPRTCSMRVPRAAASWRSRPAGQRTSRSQRTCTQKGFFIFDKYIFQFR
jgi:hypothetical protein